MGSFASRIIVEKTTITLLIRLRDPQGEPYYAYVSVPAKRFKAFQEALQRGETNLEHYGNVLQHGPGEPSDAVKQTMEQQYGCKHDVAVDVGTEKDKAEA